MNILKNPIDYESLEVELNEAIKADNLYQLQNDAKLRAIEQRVPTYDQFKDMVNAAHLKPMERSDIRPNLGVKWNSAVAATSYESSKSQLSHCFHTLKSQNSPELLLNKLDKFQSSNPNVDPDINYTVPKTTEEFLKTWKKLANHETRFDYLLTIRPVVFIEIFRPEIPLGVLGEIMDACLKNLPEGDDVDTVIDILTALSHCNRFQLSLNFMTLNEKDISKQLFRRLLARGKAGDGAAEVTVNMLRKRYQVTFD